MSSPPTLPAALSPNARALSILKEMSDRAERAAGYAPPAVTTDMPLSAVAAAVLEALATRSIAFQPILSRPDASAATSALDAMKDALREAFGQPAQKEAAVVLLRRGNDRVLGVRHAVDHGWAMPGGKREPHDRSIRHTAARELEEETGLQIDPDDLTLVHVGPGNVDPSRKVFVFEAPPDKVSGVLRPEPGTAIEDIDYATLVSSEPRGPFYLAAFDEAWKARADDIFTERWNKRTIALRALRTRLEYADPEPRFSRASGDAVCSSCGLLFRDHPEHPAGAFHVLCDGDVVKL